MSTFSSPAILLRRLEVGDFDLIVSLFTLDHGKVSAIAKSAKKSTKRFAGVLELFSRLQVVCRAGRGKGLPVLQEAVLQEPFCAIRCDVKKTAYASYWSELLNSWLEEGDKQDRLFWLFEHVLGRLERGCESAELLSILFQMRFTAISGFSPSLQQCSCCKKDVDDMPEHRVVFDLSRGGLVCNACVSGTTGRLHLSKGTIKQLLWIESGGFSKAHRIRFSPATLEEGLQFLESFVPYQVGREPRSLKFLRKIRS